MRSALFVDFDNVFSGLQRLGADYAEAFARHPSRWLDWLVNQLEHPPGASTESQRRILVRRCYLNPEPYKRFRIGFSRAGFEIVDCPPMTSAGKTSTDIHMVLDMVDVLQSQTRYDEFIVFSADADFTPLLRKLRREDRRTTIFAAGATSASYDASADLIIDPEAFIASALGFEDEGAPLSGPDDAGLIAQAEAVVWRTMDQATQPVPLPALTKALATQVPGLVQASWAGKGTFYALLRSLPLDPLRIDREINALVDPRRHAPAGLPESQVDLAAVSGFVQQEVAASDRPIAVARLAQLARERFPGIEKTWGGQGSWKRLLESLNVPGVAIVWKNLAGYALDPERHTFTLDDGLDASVGVRPDPQLAEIASFLDAAGLPLLERGRFRVLLEGLAMGLDVQPPALTTITKVARDHCVANGMMVGRNQINTVMRSLVFNGFDVATHPHHLDALINHLGEVVAAACGREGVKISDDDRRKVVDWLGQKAPAVSVPAAVEGSDVASAA